MQAFLKASRAFVRAGWTVLLLGLAGCVMSQQRAQEVDPRFTATPAGQGLLVLRVAANVASSSASAQTALELRPVTVDATGEIQSAGVFGDRTLYSKSVPNSGDALFLDPLPPGQYQLTVLRSFAAGYELTAPLVRRLVPFEIRPDRVTDLGTLILGFATGGILPDRYTLSHRRSDAENAAALAQMPAAARFATGPLRPAIVRDERLNLALASHARATADISARSAIEDGAPLALGHTLGTLSVWDPAGETWSDLDTGYLMPVRSIARERDGGLVVGLEESVLLARDGDGWRRIALPVEGASVDFVGRATTGEVFVVLHGRSDYVVLSTRDLARPQWTELRRFPVQRLLNGAHAFLLTAYLADARLVLQAGGVDGMTLHSFDLARRLWDAVPVSLYTVALLSARKDGTLCLPSGSAFNRTLNCSTDWGRSWPLSVSIGFDNTPVFRDAKTGYAWRIDSTPLFASGTLAASLLRSADGGATWTPMGALPPLAPGNLRIFPLPKPGGVMLAVGPGERYLTRDDGQSWTKQAVATPPGS